MSLVNNKFTISIHVLPLSLSFAFLVMRNNIIIAVLLFLFVNCSYCCPAQKAIPTTSTPTTSPKKQENEGVLNSDAYLSCLYISVSLEKDLLQQHRSFNGTYKYLKQIDDQPIWRSVIFDGKSGTKYNFIWKPSKNCINCKNGEWMIGEMKNGENPKIRGNQCKATPDKCNLWSYRKRNTNKDWTQSAPSNESGIHVKCIKGKKFL